MDVMYPHCAGLDVHKARITACVRHLLSGGEVQKEVRTFGTTTAELLKLSDWLREEEVTHVAMESTGVFWKPVFNILEGQFELILANARHIQNVPGRKTDVKDCEWIAQLLQFGLILPSFVPERPQRELRELTRQRVALVEDRNRMANRIHKILEDANIKLGAVATNIMGVSGRDMIRSLVAGETDTEKLATLARGRLRAKIPELKLALHGRVNEHHRFMLQLLMEQFDHLDRAVHLLEARIEETLRPSEEAIRRLSTVPGVDRVTAENILAEIGTDMSRFRTAAHLASWAGMCPGNNESAGKQKSGKTRKGSRWLRRTLTQVAWAASHSKNTYLQAQFRRLVAKRGKKRALVAVGHSVLVIVYTMLKNQIDYVELGADFFERQDPGRLTRYLVRRLEKLGHAVTLTPLKVPA